MELTSPAEGKLPRSRIFTRLYQGDGQPGKAGAAPKPTPTEAPAAPAGLGFATFKTDPNAPVDVEADKLNDDDTKKEAIYTGDVKAAQADFTIRTVELHAFYSGDAGLAAAAPVAAPAGAPAAARTPAQLTRIEAKGKVVVSSKAGQQATGDWAVFDTKANTMLIGGNEVIVTQDKDIVRCKKVRIDMPTGQTFCDGNGVAGIEAIVPTVPGAPVTIVQRSGKEGRPSLVIYPRQRPKPGEAAPPAVPAKPAASSWESAVEPARPN